MLSAISTARVHPVVAQILAEFHAAFGVEACFWSRAEESAWEVAAGAAPGERVAPGPDAAEVPDPDCPGWIEVDPAFPGAASHSAFLAAVLARALKHEADARSIGREIEYRYEEITLLYTISEILGSVISLEGAAEAILSEVAEALRVTRASLWVHDEQADQLELIAGVGLPGQDDPIPVTDPCSVTASVFRDRRPMILDPGDEFRRRPDCPAEPLPGRDPFLSVPVSYTPPRGESRTIGVINLIGRTSGGSFSAGDRMLISAIASQVGAAIENSRLVAESLRQERLVREMELAHDLQLKLLPATNAFTGLADVAARCVPAQSVGGDFYHLIRLAGGRFGVVIGDVSSHGFPAALIMALSMTAVAIHASDEESPAEVLRRVHRTLVAELESTEMYMTLFYGVIDPGQRRITYANAGHSHAFRIDSQGEAFRLSATNPPLGIIDLDEYDEAVVPWAPGEDLLFLFTDGLSDALGRGEVAGERALLSCVVPERHRSLSELLGRVFDLGQRSKVPADDRTAVFVRT